MIDDFTTIHSHRRHDSETASNAKSMCTMVFRVFPQIPAIPLQPNSSHLDPNVISPGTLANDLTSGKYTYPLSFTYASAMSDAMTTAFFDPITVRHRLATHQYKESDDVRTLRRLDNLYLIDFKECRLEGVNEIKINLRRDRDLNVWKIKSHSLITSPEPNLPKYRPTNIIPSEPIYNLDGKRFFELIYKTYEEGVFWRKNLFKVPSGNAGKAFVKILCEWLRRVNCNLDSQGIALKVFMVLPILLLQKPANCSKAKDHCAVLNRRIESLKGGNLEEIILECKSIQGHLKLRKNNQNYMKTFAKLMMQGKVNAPLRFLSEQKGSGVLQLTESVLSGLG